MVDPVQIAAFGTLISLATLALTLYFRWRDSQSRMKIECRLGIPPRAWLIEGNFSPTPQEPVAAFRVENVGRRTVSLSDAYISLANGGEMHPFSGGNPPMPSQLQPGFPRVFHQSLQGISRELVNRGCTGTAYVELVVRDGTGKLHRHAFEIPDVEARAEGREPE